MASKVGGMRDGTPDDGPESWRVVLGAAAVSLFGAERAASLEGEIARMAEALARLAGEEFDLRDPAPDLRGLSGEELG